MVELPPPPPGPARAALRLRQALVRALDAPLPAHAAVWASTLGFMRLHALATICELGVADALGGRRRATAAELAVELDLDAGHLHRILRALATEGWVRLDRRGRFSLTRKGRALRTGEMDGWVRYLALESTRRAWAAMPEAVRSGEPAFPLVHGRSTWDHFARHPQEEQLFARTMRALTHLDLPGIVRAWDWPGRGTVCDVAGGTGTVLAGVLRARPDARGVLVEAPGVLPEARRHLEAAGVAERVELREGSIFDGIDARADVYLLKDVLHDWDDARCARILDVVAAAMPRGASLVLVEQLQEPHVPEPVVSWVDVHMLAVCDGGRQRSLAELHELLRGAGLEPGRTAPTAAATLVEGVRR
ncbi:methyltransferase [Conexibacter sp. SYSU D00693]|uniref:methyltransferase n=1 Tax=Conexibacter sp. SYSU D00693 TaxID=2812560 RepID=UPI00196BA880|nr:methyltransferase [Conexibacter sp. SYSU D00693]